MDQYITTYGYLAVLLGVFIEGEIVVAAAGFFAWRGLLDLHAVMVAATIASVFTYQVYFWLGRHHGRRYLERHPDWQPRVARIQQLLHRHHLWVILGYRLLFGLRGVTPFALGLSGVSQLRFFLIDLFPAVTWGVGVTLAGYVFGPAALSLFERLGRVQGVVVVVVLAALLGALGYWWYTTLRRRR